MRKKYYIAITVVLAAISFLAVRTDSRKLREGHGFRAPSAQLRARLSPIHLPLRFETNVGQADPRAKYIARS